MARRVQILVFPILILLQSTFCYQDPSQTYSHNNELLNPFHPLDPLSAAEIQLTTQIIRNVFRSVPQLAFSVITLKEPRKAELIASFLQDVQPPATVPRKSFSIVIDPVLEISYEVVVDLRRYIVESLVQVPHGLQSMFTIDEVDDISQTVLEDDGVLRRLAQLGVSNISTVVPSFWDFGYAGDRPEILGRRVSQVYFFVMNFPDDNYYARPLDFIANVDILKNRVLGIEDLPIHSGFDVINRQGALLQMTPRNYDPTLLPKDFFRRDVSPITFTQPAGAGYKAAGNLISWQNFKLRIGFNEREGLVLYNINYNDKGTVRPLIYRAALSELLVPYGDPRPPYHRKIAFDVGQYGMGNAIHELQNPADCKGVVTFFDVVVHNKAGNPVTIKKAICVFEEDAGNLMKKFDPVTGRAYAVRAQRLVVSFTCSSGNYDYEFKWMFYQDASMRMEAHLYGIDSPSFVASGENSGGHGTILSQNILAQNHQHLFVVRVDADFDGTENSVATVDVLSTGATGSSRNPYGNGFTAVETILRTAAAARTQSNPLTARTWAIHGDGNKRNPVTGTGISYKLIADDPVHLMQNPDSPMHPKCAFADYTLWVTPYQEDQLYAGGLFLNNSGLPEWVGLNPNANVENTDVVLWHVFGLTHIPRVEDFPIMSAESVGFWLKPYNFFVENPALDVPSFLNIP